MIVSMPAHGRLPTGFEITCQEFNLQFPSRAALDIHAKESQHSPYWCLCQKAFSRIDVLDRHVRNSQPTGDFPCLHCTIYRGSRAFACRDHLLQHLRGYHHIESPPNSENSQLPEASSRSKRRIFNCPHEDCQYHRSANFQVQQRQYQEANGPFQSQAVFIKHMRDVH
jgi:hypothetical protein